MVAKGERAGGGVDREFGISRCKLLYIEWINMWYIYTMEDYSAIKRNETGSFVETWMDLETVIQSEVSQKEKNKYHILTHICGI